MAGAAEHTLFAVDEMKPGMEPMHSTGVVPSQGLREAVERGEIKATEPINEGQIQPASVDLRLGPIAYRTRASFLPGRGASVGQKIEAYAMHQFSLDGGAVLEKGCVYLAPVMESLQLRHRTSAMANPKSSTGRLDVFCRLITDGGTEFDHVRAGYHGPLWIEISPRSFSILVETGTRLLQLRIKRGAPRWSDAALRELHAEVGLIDDETVFAENVKRGLLAITVDAQGNGGSDLIGWRARKNADLIDVSKVNYYDPRDYWEPVRARTGQGVILDPNDFYILSSRESVTVPADHAAEMLAYDTLVGEFRVHYAGFFDPGFGLADVGGEGTRAVLEVRSRDVPFMIEDGQVVGRLLYERLTALPDKLYGRDIGSNYQRQGLALSKQFKRP
ncbi:MAG: 2'-deoxycytidine 5'-triphosphate deaminase [Rhodospirillaceae bacterium]|nr:2'-deoxycytidine 5'-triphosphate deaminase [Rhodospirillaceae bacterium]